MNSTPKKHHIDKRAAKLLADEAEDRPDDLLSTTYVSRWFGCSRQWLEAARHYGFGPRWVKLSPRMVKYKRADVLQWLRDRSFTWTGEYPENSEQSGKVTTPTKDKGKVTT